MADESSAWTWKDVVDRLRGEEIDTRIEIPITDIEEPVSAGLHAMPANAEGPMFGVVLDDETGILVQVCGEVYKARLWRVPKTVQPPPWASAPVRSASPASAPPPSPPALRQSTEVSRAQVSQPILVETRTELVVSQQREPRSLMTFPAEQPGATMLATSVLGALFGLAVGGPKGAAYGAMLGAGAGLASIAVSTAATNPAAAMAAQTMFLALVAASLGGNGGGRVLRLDARPQRRLPPWLDDDDGSPRPRRPRKK